MYNLVILGAGESGTGAALLAQARGLQVFVSDKGSIAEVFRQELENAGIPFEENQHTEALILGASEVIKSPGIPDKNPLVIKLREKGIPVIDELEFAYRYSKARFIGITGSNGKTTTTLLCHHLMLACGFRAGLAGNVGKSLARQVISEDQDWFVVEISSFQLDGLLKFRNEISVLTNITPDHLDRYEYRFENYIQSKFRIMNNQGEDAWFISSSSDPVVGAELANRQPAPAVLMAGQSAAVSPLLFTDGESLHFSLPGMRRNHLPLSEFPLSGQHNQMNGLMAIAAVLLAGGDFEKIRSGLQSFRNAPHRCEPVGKIGGVQFVNDSKATNVDSVKYAFSAFEKPIIWIAGGVDKGNDYSELDEAVREKVKALICLGTDNDKLKAHFRSIVPRILETQSVSSLVELAMQEACAGDTVLLSPACASFDLFRNYEDRGNQFREAVARMENQLSGLNPAMQP